jgi:hypothetical protein
MRQRFEPGPGVSISTLAYDYPPKWQIPEHEHACYQLVLAQAGVMEVSVAQSRWLIPAQFAIWIPAHVRHSIRMPNAVAMRTLYLRLRLARSRECTARRVAEGVISNPRHANKLEPQCRLAGVSVRTMQRLFSCMTSAWIFKPGAVGHESSAQSNRCCAGSASKPSRWDQAIGNPARSSPCSAK